MTSKVRLKDFLREKDAFLTTSERFYNFYLTHTRKIVIGVLALALIVLGVVAGVAISRSRAEKAAREYYLAYDPSSHEATLAAMAEVRDRWKGRRAGRLAGFAMVDSYIGLGRFPEARALADELASGLSGPELTLAPLVYNLQGALAEQAGDLEAALDHYGRAWEAVETPPAGPGGKPVSDPLYFEATGPFRMEILNARARVNLALGKDEEARKAYRLLETRFPGTPRAYAAGYRVYEIDSKSAAPAGGSPASGDSLEGTVTSEDLPPTGAAAPQAGEQAGDGAPVAAAPEGDGDAPDGASGAAPEEGGKPPAASDGAADPKKGNDASPASGATDPKKGGDASPAGPSGQTRSGR